MHQDGFEMASLAIDFSVASWNVAIGSWLVTGLSEKLEKALVLDLVMFTWPLDIVLIAVWYVGCVPVEVGSSHFSVISKYKSIKEI